MFKSGKVDSFVFDLGQSGEHVTPIIISKAIDACQATPVRYASSCAGLLKIVRVDLAHGM